MGRLGAVLLGSDGSGPIRALLQAQGEQADANPYCDAQDYRDAIPCSSFTAGVLPAMRATYRELHQG